MPYKKVGSNVYKKEGGKTKLVGHSSKGKIEGYMRALHMVEHGIKMTGKKK